MRLRLLCAALLTLGAVSLGAQESVALTTPVVKTATSVCHLSTLTLNVDSASVVAVLGCNNADVITKTYDASTTPSGATLLHALNTANFTTNSFIKAVYTRLIADGVLTGTISGTAQ